MPEGAQKKREEGDGGILPESSEAEGTWTRTRTWRFEQPKVSTPVSHRPRSYFPKRRATANSTASASAHAYAEPRAKGPFSRYGLVLPACARAVFVLPCPASSCLVLPPI